jgi:hypothetical protein
MCYLSNSDQFKSETEKYRFLKVLEKNHEKYLKTSGRHNSRNKLCPLIEFACLKKSKMAAARKARCVLRMLVTHMAKRSFDKQQLVE